MAIIIKTNGTKEPLILSSDHWFRLKDLQRAVGGYIEPITMEHPIEIDGIEYVQGWVNEEGKIHGLRENLIATEYWAQGNGVPMHLMNDILVGDVVFITREELEAEMREGEDD